jgi:hypothetical protein
MWALMLYVEIDTKPLQGRMEAADQVQARLVLKQI